ncbi:hypothetical protein WA577_007242 [Blastocystis sp. JDR]
MNSVDENITRCLEEIDANFVKAIDIVSSISRSVKGISLNLKEMNNASQQWLDFFNVCSCPHNASQSRESVGTLVLTDDETGVGLVQPIDPEEQPSFLQDQGSDAYLKYMSPPRTTSVYKPLNTPGADRDTSAMDTSSSSLFGYSPPQTPLLKRRKHSSAEPASTATSGS